MDNQIKEAAEIIKNSKNMIALTGAGISVESGIPDFRSSGGLWEKYDPSVYAMIDTFISNPEKVWEMIFDMVDIMIGAKPNDGHKSLAKLEELGLLKALITQNIDNLHQAAGSKKVIEYHGNASKLQCMQCGGLYDIDRFDHENKIIPRCDKCHNILKPTIVFFGEAIPIDVMMESERLAKSADVILVVATSAIIYPAASIPIVAKNNNATIIEFNLEETALTYEVTDIFVKGSAGKTLPQMIKLLTENAENLIV